LIWLLVIGGEAQAGDRFTDNGDGTVTDHEMGLMWARKRQPGRYQLESGG
jgi:hypothetical protein